MLAQNILCYTIAITLVLFSISGLFILWIWIYKKILHEYLKKYKYNKVEEKIRYYASLSQEEILTHKSEIDELLEYKKRYNVNEISGLTIQNIILTEKVKAILDEMIIAEVYSALRQYLSLNSKYPITNIDKDVKDVSNKVFNALNPKIYKSDLLFNDTYILSYIVGQSFNIILKLTTELNLSILN